MKYYENISLGFGEEENGTLYAKQHDDGTRRVRFTMMDGNGKVLTNSQLSAWHFYFRMLCPNGAQIHDDACLMVDGDNLVLTFDENMLASAGMANADILVSSDDNNDGTYELISTCSFQIFIDAAPFSNRGIEAHEDFNTLKTMMERVDGLVSNIEKVESGLTAGEQIRISNENNRIAAEAQRESDFDDIKDTTTGLIAQAKAARDDSVTAKDESTKQANYAKSWAVGGTGLRIDEETNNSKYYSSLAESWVRGNTGVRTDENTNNATYLAKIAQSYANGTSGIRAGENKDNAKYYSDLAKGSADAVVNIETDIKGYDATFKGYLSNAEKAKDDAETAKTDAEKARDAAVAAKNSVDTTKGAIDTIKAAIDQAKSDVDQYKIDAQTARNEAVTAKGQAEGFATNAGKAKDDAVAAKEAAEKAASEAAAIAGVETMTTTKNGIGRPDGTSIQVTKDGVFSINPQSSLASHASRQIVTNSTDDVHGVRIYKEDDGLYDIEKFDADASAWSKVITSPRIMTDTKLGLAKVDGTTIKVDPDGTLHGASSVEPATDTKLGGVLVDGKQGVDVDTTGMLSVKVDDETISIDTDGVLRGNKYSVDTTKVIYASSWVGSDAPFTYDLGYDNTVDVEIMLQNTASTALVEAVIAAQIAGNGTDNLLRAWGEKPTIDIPILVKVTKRNI